MNLEQYFPKADRGALRLMKRMLAFDPAERPTSEEALADPYFAGLSQPGREPSAQPVSKLSFDFERKKLTTDEAGLLASLDLRHSAHSSGLLVSLMCVPCPGLLVACAMMRMMSIS